MVLNQDCWFFFEAKFHFHRPVFTCVYRPVFTGLRLQACNYRPVFTGLCLQACVYLCSQACVYRPVFTCVYRPGFSCVYRPGFTCVYRPGFTCVYTFYTFMGEKAENCTKVFVVVIWDLFWIIILLTDSLLSHWSTWETIRVCDGYMVNTTVIRRTCGTGRSCLPCERQRSRETKQG